MWFSFFNFLYKLATVDSKELCMATLKSEREICVSNTAIDIATDSCHHT